MGRHDDPDENITVDMDFTLEGEAQYGRSTTRLYFMSDGTVRWQRP